MIDFSAPRLLAISLTFFLAGIVKGVTGMGLPTVAMGVLGAIMPPLAAATLLIAPSFVTNVWQLFSGPNFLALASRLWLMMARHHRRHDRRITAHRQRRSGMDDDRARRGADAIRRL